ncbi:hypothetical protein ACHAWF_008113 [Thalassiosira exigua]
MRRSLSSSLSSCFDSVEAIFEIDPASGLGPPSSSSDAYDGEEFVRDGGRIGAIFLGGHRLGDKGVARIVDGLEDPCRDYYKLYLDDNRIGVPGASSLSRSLRCNATLLELGLENNRLGDEGARCLASALAENDTLVMLNLEKNGVGPSGTAAIADALEHRNNSLQWLVLSENPIGDEGAKAMLRCVGNTSSFDRLQLCNHTLLSVVLKKVTQVKDHATLRKIHCYLKINRLSSPFPAFARQRKILTHAKENPDVFLEYLHTIRRDDAKRELSLHPLILALLGQQCELSTIFMVVQSSAHIFLNDPDIDDLIRWGR